jgi:carboxymethylenebutenolidase
VKIISSTIDIGEVRAFVTRPVGEGRFPAVVAYSDIFQLTPPHLRLVARLAGYGFVVVAPEIYGRIEPKGTVLDFEADRQRAQDDAAKLALGDVDADLRTVLDAVTARADVGDVGALGFCFGGHVAFRAALDSRVKATACCYPTGVHDDKLGASSAADTLARVREISGELLIVWGRADPHIPDVGRAKIHRALDAANVRFEARLFDAEHTFMRDAGARFDPEAADRAFAAILELFRRNLRA